MTQIQPEYVNLETLISRRLFRIPRYQRSYSWGKKQRQDLFNDIKSSYASETPSDHFMATIVALRRDSVRIKVTEYQKVDIVDGQQRISTLIMLLKAISKALDCSDEAQEDIRDDIEETLIKADKASQLLLQTNHDTDDYFARYIREGIHDNANNAKTLAGKQLLMAMDECELFVRDWQDEDHYLVDLIAHLFNRLTFIFHEISDESLVYTVFEVLNSRGLEVSWFDRLKSMLMAIIFENENSNEIINEVHSLWGDIYGIIGLRIGMSTESLRFAATLQSQSPLSRPLGEAEAAKVLHSKANNDPGEVIKVTHWIKSVTQAVDELRRNHRINAVTRIQQARLVATAINLRNDIEAADKEHILRYWEKISFRIYGMFRKDARTAVGDYTRLAWNIVNKKLSKDQIIASLADIGQEYPIDEALAQIKSRNCYEGWGEELRYFFHRYEERLSKMAGQDFNNKHWDHIWAVNASESIEHIMPQNSERKYIHWLGNLLLLPPKLNSKLGAKKPKQKADAYRATGMRIAERAAVQVSEDWSLKKVERREQELLDWARDEWSG